MMRFVKFDADENENQDDEVDKETEKSCILCPEVNKAAKRKGSFDCQEDCEKPVKRKSNWEEIIRRKAKNIHYNDCKDDLKHIFYIQTITQRKVSHTVMPDFNVGLNALEDLEDLPKNVYPHCTMDEPTPIYYAKKHCDSVDACFRRTIEYASYKYRLKHVRTRYQSRWKSSRQIRKLAQDSAYDSNLFTFAERLENKPDPFFYGNYDFYYTGGNLCAYPGTEAYNVLHVDDNRFGILKLSTYPRFGDVTNSSTLQERTSIKLPTDEEILEIALLNSPKITRDLVAVRQLNNITLLNIDTTDNDMKMIVDFQAKTAPFIGMAQSLEKPELFVVTTMKQNIRVYDISRPKTAYLKHLFKMQPKNSAENIVSCWNRVKPWHGETFLYVNEHQLLFADFRAPLKDWLKNECTFSSKEYPCEYNTALVLSEFQHLFYVGTTHKLRCLDARYIKQQTHYEQSVVCEWCHQLDYPPVFLDVHREEAQEYVACAGQLPGDLRICELTKTKHLKEIAECAFESHCMPWQPPTLQEAYESACLAGKLLKPEIDMKQRLRACTTGLGFLNFGSNQAMLLYANSAGDVYAQGIKRRHSQQPDKRTTARSDDIIGEFAKNLCELPQLTLNYTDIVDLKTMPAVFFATKLNRKIIKQETADANTEQTKDSSFKRSKGRWRKSMATLQTYKDALVPDLLSIWDIPCEDETDIKFSTLKNKFKDEKSENDVLNWLNRNDKIAPTTAIPLSNLSMSTMDVEAMNFEAQAQSTQILKTESYEITFLNGSDTMLDNSNLNNQTSRNIIAKPKAAKASKTKKKHVKGF